MCLWGFHPPPPRHWRRYLTWQRVAGSSSQCGDPVLSRARLLEKVRLNELSEKTSKVQRRLAPQRKPAFGMTAVREESLRSTVEKERLFRAPKNTKNKDSGRRPNEDECQERWLDENWLGRASVPLTDHQGGNKIPAAR